MMDGDSMRGVSQSASWEVSASNLRRERRKENKQLQQNKQLQHREMYINRSLLQTFFFQFIVNFVSGNDEQFM